MSLNKSDLMSWFALDGYPWSMFVALLTLLKTLPFTLRIVPVWKVDCMVTFSFELTVHTAPFSCFLVNLLPKSQGSFSFLILTAWFLGSSRSSEKSQRKSIQTHLHHRANRQCKLTLVHWTDWVNIFQLFIWKTRFKSCCVRNSDMLKDFSIYI